jgi:hypothetical protein
MRSRRDARHTPAERSKPERALSTIVAAGAIGTSGQIGTNRGINSLDPSLRPNRGSAIRNACRKRIRGLTSATKPTKKKCREKGFRIGSSASTFCGGITRCLPLRQAPRLVSEDFDRVRSAISKARNALRTRDEHSFRLKLSTEEKLPFRRKFAEKCGKRA